MQVKEGRDAGYGFEGYYSEGAAGQSHLRKVGWLGSCLGSFFGLALMPCRLMLLDVVCMIACLIV